MHWGSYKKRSYWHNKPQHSNAAAVHICNGSDLSRFQSLTEPSAAHEARLTSFLSRDTVALGWNTIAPTLVLCPEGKGKTKFTICNGSLASSSEKQHFLVTGEGGASEHFHCVLSAGGHWPVTLRQTALPGAPKAEHPTPRFGTLKV